MWDELNSQQKSEEKKKTSAGNIKAWKKAKKDIRAIHGGENGELYRKEEKRKLFQQTENFKRRSAIDTKPFSELNLLELATLKTDIIAHVVDAMSDSKGQRLMQQRYTVELAKMVPVLVVGRDGKKQALIQRLVSTGMKLEMDNLPKVESGKSTDADDSAGSQYQRTRSLAHKAFDYAVEKGLVVVSSKSNKLKKAHSSNFLKSTSFLTMTNLIDRKSGCITKSGVYFAMPNESMASIANKLDIRVEHLMELNEPLYTGLRQTLPLNVHGDDFAVFLPTCDMDRAERMKVICPEAKERGTPNPTTGLIGVYKNGEKYKVSIKYGGTKHYLGTFDTKEQAGMAYDRFVVDKSTEEVSFNTNYPRT